MADSLTIGGVIETLGGGVESTSPDADGAVFYLGRAFDLGAPSITTEQVTGLLLDGSQVVSSRVDNRKIVLPVTIRVSPTGDLAADRLTLAGARELLLSVVSAERWPLVWTREGGQALVYDCQSISAVVINWSVIHQRNLFCQVEIDTDALPWGHSDDEETILLAAPALTFDQPVPPVTIDLFGTAINFLTGDASGFSVGIAGWVPAVNATIARTTAQAHTAPGALALTAVGAGAMSAAHCSAAASPVSGMVCQPGDTITARGFSRAATVARSVNVGVDFTDSNGVAVGATLRGSNVTNSTTVFTTQPAASVTAPQGAAFARINFQVLAAAAGEVHYFDDAYLDRGTVASSAQPAAWSQSSVTAVTGQGSAFWSRIKGDAPSYVRVLPAPVDLTGRTKFGFMLGLAATTSTYKNWHRGPIQARLTLTDSGGDQIKFGVKNWHAQASALNRKPHWQQVSAHIPQNVPQFDYTQVAAYSVQVWNAWNNYLIQPVLQASAYLGNVMATATSTGAAGTRGALFTLPGIVGSARAPLALQAAPGPSAFSTVVEFTTPGVGNWTAPAGVTSVDKCEALAAGGDGSGGDTGLVQAGGAGGGGEYAMDPGHAVTPLAVYHPVVGAPGTGGTANVSNQVAGGDSWFTSDSKTTYAHGGHFGYRTPTWGGSKGGSGSNSYLHYPGGDGRQSAAFGTGQHRGGGGGSSAGPGGPGQDATGWDGAPPVSGGGPGGQGGRMNTSPQQGQMPTAGYGGGGGGGSMDGSGGHNGGGGQGGKIRLAYGAAGILPMNSLLVHIPPREESSAYSPICPVGNGADVPNGSVEYTVPPVSALPARFDGTYSAWLVASTYSSPSSARTVIVTLRQYAYAGGPSTTVALTRTLTPANDAVNGYTDMGAVTLPLWDLPPGNTDAYFTATIASGLTADRFFDLILLSTTGQVVFVNMTGTAFAQNMWIDVPELGRDLGRVLASDADRDRARSVVGSDPSNRISGGPLCVTPNAHNRLLIYQGLGMPSATLSYLPNWWADRLS